jgi:O-antigen/teichoic acid export membrane protein
MNTSVAFVAQISAILMGFFTRVVFTRMLSEGYVGINGLFTDILNILSLSELGVGTAITYALYRPIAENDISKQQILMRMFRTFYRMTAGFVLVAGMCLIPFLDILMKDLSFVSFELCGFISADLQKNTYRCTSDELYHSAVP